MKHLENFTTYAEKMNYKNIKWATKFKLDSL